jgi:cytochrome oxidase assembly protein ShyY1
MAHPYHADFWIAAATVAPVVLIAHAVVATDLGKKISVLKAAGSRSGWQVTWYSLAAAALLAGGLLAWEAFRMPLTH